MLTDIITKISTESGLSEKEILDKISEKQEELSGLISAEGAAYMVAKELGVSVRTQERLFLQNIVPGMQNVDVVGRIVRIFPAREFKTEKAQGRVLNFFLADETGSVRVSLWNDEIEKLAEFKEGDVVRMKGLVREDNLGEAELRLGRYGLLQKSKEKIPAVALAKRVERSNISDLREGQFREVRAALLQVFESEPLFAVCSKCGTGFKDGCKDHPDAEPEHRMILSGIIDDGTENIRAVFFGENAGKILGMNTEEVIKFLQRNKLRELLKNVDIGREMIIEGRVRRNAFFDRLEFVASDVKDVDVKDEIRKLIPE